MALHHYCNKLAYRISQYTFRSLCTKYLCPCWCAAADLVCSVCQIVSSLCCRGRGWPGLFLPGWPLVGAMLWPVFCIYTSWQLFASDQRSAAGQWTETRSRSSSWYWSYWYPPLLPLFSVTPWPLIWEQAMLLLICCMNGDVSVVMVHEIKHLIRN